jgi:septum site-determining protein MinC
VPPAQSLWPEAVGGLFLRRTLRSGQSIQHDGDVCIIGDVNPGAEVLAGGDVVVWGSLRGLVHAGAGGNTEAVICALQLAPTQLRIADTRSRGPEPGSAAAGQSPEMARSVEGRIVVEPWTGPRPRR